MSEKECQTADWRLIGYEDGRAGRSTLQLKEHRESCAEHGVSPDLDLYLQGHESGLMKYCRPAQAFRIGRAGHSYPSLCPSDLEDELRAAFDDGVKVHRHQSRVNRVQQRIATNRKRYEDNELTLKEYQVELLAKETTNQRRLELLAETVSLSKEQDELMDEIDLLEGKLRIRRKELRLLEQQLKY